MHHASLAKGQGGSGRSARGIPGAWRRVDHADASEHVRRSTTRSTCVTHSIVLLDKRSPELRGHVIDESAQRSSSRALGVKHE
jgi:hypothetical protein